MRMRTSLLVAVFLALGAGPASATTVGYHVAFGAGNFTVDPNPGGDTPPLLVIGSFDVDLDIGTSPTNQTTGLHNTSIGAIKFDSSNYPFVVDTPWAFDYDSAADILIVGGSSNGADSIHFGSPGTENDFYLQIHNFSTANPLMWQLGFSQSATPGANFFSPTGGALANGFAQVTNLGPVATPLPAGLPLLLTALAGIGLLAMGRKSAASASAAA
jgi:hypothetical protein